MAVTQVEAAGLTQDMMHRGVIETIVKESSILMMLPFMQVVGTALTYNREGSMPQASFYDPGDTWTEATPEWSQMTEPLRIIGGDADIDAFLQQTYANPNDIEAVVIESRAKAVAHQWSQSFYAGDNSDNARQFNGLRTRLDGHSTQEIQVSTNGGQLTLDKMDELIDLVKPGRPDALLMSKRTRRKLSSLRRSSGSLLESDVDDFGRRALFYDGIPLLVDDFLPDDEELGTGSSLSSIYAVKFGSGGVMGLENQGIQIERVGELETKDATRWRVKWYASMVILSELGTARLKGVAA